MSTSSAVTADAGQAFVPGQYVIIPKTGLCVMTGIKPVEIGDVREEVMEFRPLKSVGTTVLKPVRRLATTGIRLPVEVAEMQDVLRSAFGAVKGDGGGGWHKRAATYEEQLASAAPIDLAHALNKILSKHRTAKFKADKVDGDLPPGDKISISFSEREIANAALDNLGQELAHITGTGIGEARRTIMRAALVQNYAATITLNAESTPAPVMAAEKFTSLFGHMPGEMPSGAPIKIATVRAVGGAVYARPMGRIGQRRVAGNAEQDNVRGAGRSEYDPRRHLTGDYLALFEEEDMLVPVGGPARTLFRHAPRGLDVDQFRVLVQHDLREAEERLSIEQIAAATGKMVEVTIALRNAASTRLASTLASAGITRPNHPALRPYAPARTSLAATQAPAPVRIAPPVAVIARPAAPTSDQPPVPASSKGVRADNRALFAAEADNIAIKGIMRGLFITAARVLEAPAFQLLVMTELRTRGRVTLDEAATAMRIPAEEARGLYRAAAETLGKACGYDLNGARMPKFLRPQPAPEAAIILAKPEEPAPAIEPVFIAEVREASKPPAPQSSVPTPKARDKLLQSIPDANRPIFDAEEPVTPSRGMLRGLVVTAARVLDTQGFQIVTQTALRTRGRVSLEEAARALEIPFDEALDLRNRAMATLLRESGYNPDGAKAPAFLKPLAVRPVFAEAAEEPAAPAAPQPAKTAPERGISAEQVGFAQVGDEIIVIVRVPRNAIHGSYGLKLDLSWKKAVDGTPEILKAAGGIKSRPGLHAASGTAEFEEPTIQPPPSTLDPS